ncbi:cold-shock protein [Rhizobium rhizogenes]|uniref:cold-shock protein n=1 Tax=Rhizobium rhizogenes TaxID=359 RepID=UPI0022C83C27|nr:cold-shock protein [Rhizobium rhizogenes]MCZ7486989.1 cold-shock protein [Rhizobium rhizogenes]
MRKNLYRSGDAIVLKAGVLGSNQPSGPGRITMVLPETQGLVRFRVRFQNENFERNIASDEIDTASSLSRGMDAESLAPRASGSSWINTSTIKVRK